MTKASWDDLFVLASFRLPMLKGIEDEGIKDVLSACHELEEMGDKRGGEGDKDRKQRNVYTCLNEVERGSRTNLAMQLHLVILATNQQITLA